MCTSCNATLATRPKNITVRLLANGVETGDVLILSEDNGWTGSFTNLPLTKDNIPIEYTVREDRVPGYIGRVSGNAGDGFIITNQRPTGGGGTPPGGGNRVPGIPSKPNIPERPSRPSTGKKQVVETILEEEIPLTEFYDQIPLAGTGDNSKMLWYLGGAIAAALGLMFWGVKRRKRS